MIRAALALALTLPAAHAALPAAAPLAWSRPGADPYRGTVRDALASMHLPPEVAARLAARIEARDADGRVWMRDDGIVADDGAVYAPHFDMTTGARIAAGSRIGRGVAEPAALYRDGVYAIAVPAVCGNVTRLWPAGFPHYAPAPAPVLPEVTTPPGGWWPGTAPAAPGGLYAPAAPAPGVPVGWRPEPAPIGPWWPGVGGLLPAPGGAPGIVPAPAPTSSVPVPGTALLLSAGVVLAAIRRRA